jgi:iron(III) transport system substrate-binding protein
MIAGAGAVIASAAAQPATAQTQSMAALVSAAKAEGSVIVDGPPVDAVREALVGGFQRAYGIPVSYIASGTSASGARVRAERAAGKYLLDAYIAGPDTPTVTFLPNG